MMDLLYIALTAVVVGLCLKGPRWGVPAVAAILPMSVRLPNPPIPLLNMQNLLLVAAMSSLAFGGKREGRTGSVRFVIPLALFILVISLSYLNTRLTFVPVRYFMQWNPYELLLAYKTILCCVLLYVLGCIVPRSVQDVKAVATGILAGIIAEISFICMEVFMRGPARANGHLQESNNAGAWSSWALMVCVALFLVVGWRNRMGKICLATAGASVFALLFTMSRGNWMAAVVAGGVLTLMRDRRALILLVLGLFAAPFWVPQKVQSRIDETFVSAEDQAWRFRIREGTNASEGITSLQEKWLGSSDGTGRRLDGSSQIRLFVWQAGMQMIRDYPMGVGFGVFSFYLGQYSDIVKFKAAHNTYLLLAAENGLVTLLLFLLFLGLLCWESWMVYWTVRDPFLSGLGLAAFASTISMVVSAFFYNFWFMVEINGQQWVLLGLMTQVRRIAAQTQEVPAAVAVQAPVSSEPVPLYKLVT